MKKLIGLVAIVFFASVAFAQTSQVKQDTKKTPAKTETAKPAEKQTAKPAAKPAEKPAEKAAAPTKKDGTPDMRYKENKDAAKTAAPATHLKKDGTPDKRYKENKDAPKK